MRFLKDPLLLFFVLALLLSGCGEPPVRVAYASTGIGIQAVHSWRGYYSNRSFWVVPFDEMHEGSAKFKQLGAVIENQLMRQGLTRAPYDRGKPKLLVILGYGSAASRTEEIEYPYFRTRGAIPFIPREPPTAIIQQSYVGMRPSDWRLVTTGPQKRGPHYGVVISVIIVEMDWRKPERSRVIWAGEAMGTDTTAVAGREAVMIRALFQDFPGKNRQTQYLNWP